MVQFKKKKINIFPIITIIKNFNIVWLKTQQITPLRTLKKTKGVFG